MRINKTQKNIAMKDSGVDWIGEIPSDWDVLTNRAVLSFAGNGKNLSNNTTVLSLTKKGVKIKKNLNFGKSTENYIGHQIVKPGNIVFTPRDFDQTPILSGIAKDYGCISNLYFVLNTKKDVFNEFVNYYWWGIKYGVDYFNQFSFGMRSSFNRQQFNSIPFLKPPKQTQEKIVEFLDEKTGAVAELVEKKKKMIELLKEKRSSLITHAVTKGLPARRSLGAGGDENGKCPSASGWKDSGVEWIGEIPSDWEMIKIKNFGEVILGLTYSPVDQVDKISGTLVMRSSNIKNGQIVSSEEKNVYVKTNVSQKLKLQENDLLICSRNGSKNLIGKNALITKKFVGETFGAFMTVLRGSDNVYLYWVLNSSLFKEQTGLFLTSTINQLTVNNLKNMIIPIPPKQTQQEIVEFLDKETSKIDKVISKIEKQIELLDEYKASLIYHAVTGKIEV